MKILELTNFSVGACGVWIRVKQESEQLKKLGFNVKIFSSNRVKGLKEKAPERETISGINIRRFPATKLGGESFMRWDFEKEALDFKPDVIIAHSYRHLHTLKALKIKKKLGCKAILVTHAPFSSESNRSFPSNLFVKLFDRVLAERTLKQYDKILTIAKWEKEILINLGAPKEKIVYLPNGIPKEFFKQKGLHEKNNVLFLGRVSPIKNIETLIKSISFVKNKKIIFEIAGPAEEDYKKELISLGHKLGVSNKIKFSGPVYELNKKIKKIDSAKVFVLPSLREGMPQSLIEAMAREKIVISSNNIGSKELISNGKNGYLFQIRDEKELASLISKCLSGNTKKMGKAARKSVEQFSWEILSKRLDEIIQSL